MTAVLNAVLENRDQSCDPPTPGVPKSVVYQAMASLPYGVAVYGRIAASAPPLARSIPVAVAVAAGFSVTGMPAALSWRTTTDAAFAAQASPLSTARVRTRGFPLGWTHVPVGPFT